MRPAIAPRRVLINDTYQHADFLGEEVASMATSSEEDYLRAIYELDNGTGMVRSVDVANQLGVSKPSVNKALAVLEDEGHISRLRYGPISLTHKGKINGKRLHDRYVAVQAFLTDKLGLAPDFAAEEAHKMEHALSKETVNKLKEFMDSETASTDKK